MNRKSSKQLDTVIAKLFEQFLKADKVREDPASLNLTLKTIKYFGEIQDYKIMYQRYFIPQTNKYLVHLKDTIRGSQFKKFITNEFVDLEENKNETIRLAIIGIYHKYESFRKDLVRNFNDFLIAKGIVDANIEKYTEENYQFKLKENWKNTTLFEVSWICNRIKHDSSLPINFEHPDHAIPSKFENLDPDKKMVLSSSEFYEYCDSIYQYCHDLYQIFNQISLKILLMEDDIDDLTSKILDLRIRKGIDLLNNRIN